MRIDGVEVAAGDWDAVCEDLLWWWHAHVCLYSAFGLDLESLPDFVTVYIAEYKMPVAVRAHRRQLREAAEAGVPSFNSLPFCADFDFNPLVQGAYVFKRHDTQVWNSKVVPWMHRSVRRAQEHFCCAVWLLLRKLVCYTSLLEPSELMDDDVRIIVAQVLLWLESNIYCVWQYNTAGRE
jgi:hypothetical protein